MRSASTTPARLFAFRQRRHVGRRRRRRRVQDVVQNPLAAHDRRGPRRLRRHHQDRALAEQPLARIVGQRHATELASVHVRNAVVPGEPFVDERVVGRHQVEDVAVLAHDALEEELCLAPERQPQVVVEIGEHHRVRLMIREVPQVHGRRSWPRSVPTSDRPACGEPGARARPGPSTGSSRRFEQLVVGDAAPEEERETRREFEIAETVGATRGELAGSRSARKTNFGLASTRCSATWMPRSKSRCLRPSRQKFINRSTSASVPCPR